MDRSPGTDSSILIHLGPRQWNERGTIYLTGISAGDRFTPLFVIHVPMGAMA